MVPRILIVDDKPTHLATVKDSLRVMGTGEWDYFEANSVESGVAILKDQLRKEEPISVVLTDLNLDEPPRDESNGLIMIEEALKQDSQVSVILYSVLRVKDREKAFNLGAFDVVEQNFDGRAASNEILRKTQRALRQRESSDRISLLSRFMSQEVVRMIEKDPSFLEMKERNITIGFWDIQGFSSFSDFLRTDPQLVASFLKEYCQDAARIIFSHDGILDKFIGDGVMALFGVFDSKPDFGASSAVKTACEFRICFDTLVRRSQPSWVSPAEGRSVDIGLRCGIHTGKALVGCTGTLYRDQFTALGTSVNLASRIEKEADGTNCQILISKSTMQKLGNEFRLKPEKTVSDVKGIVGAFELFSVDC
jgi:adenylate cyclase